MPDAETAAAKPLPVTPFLKIPDGGEPYLEGCKCGHCGEVFIWLRVPQLAQTMRWPMNTSPQWPHLQPSR